ncbi:MAG: hypothetical protein DRO96_01055 [Candidatus Aenigmatarchaeota archaeon]|nr:MAG: hypothetical protein DRO96_01055 [Candidatus Aenigmarchaeota archaeon]
MVIVAQEKTERLKVVEDIWDSEKILSLAENLAEQYSSETSSSDRKIKGQFFTPKEVAVFMAGMFDIRDKKSIRFLDPGAGIGMLTAAFCSRLLLEKKKVPVAITVYENDKDVCPNLHKVLEACRSALEKSGCDVSVEHKQEDFIEENVGYVQEGTLFASVGDMPRYDCIVSNPPYFKLNKDSRQAKLMSTFVSGQPNIYAFFMALSLKMLSQQGEMVYITPRSFCSGLYFKRFRKWLLDIGHFNRIHMFKSRKNVFTKNEVLQENVIVSLSPSDTKNIYSKVVVSTSDDRQFHNLKEYRFDKEDVLHRSNGDVFIKIPSSVIDVEVQHAISTWSSTLKDFGIKASTGPVVSFRATQHLSPTFIDKRTVPLLWMHNIQDMQVVWPLEKKKREHAIKSHKESKPLLLPTKNYVLIKRFSSKEQKRRLYAAVLKKSDFNFEYLGIENHLNYVFRNDGELTLEEAYGISGILNTSIMDAFFRMMNGNTQVNAVDIMNLPLPSLDNIKKIGKSIIKKNPTIGQELDKTVSDVLGINEKLIDKLNTREEAE